MQNYPTLLFQIAIGPNVMVADKVMNLNAQIGQLADFPQKPCITFWYHIAVLVPEVEHIT